MKFLSTVLLVAIPAASPAAAQTAAPIIRAEIDFTDRNNFVDIIQSLGGALSNGGAVYLDLTIRPSVEKGKPNYRVYRQRGNGRARAVSCADGYARFTTTGERFTFAFNPDYNHLLLEIGHVQLAQAPFNTVGCDYRANDEYASFFIRGYFAVSVISIPTANDIQLRPISPTVAPAEKIAQ